MADPVAALGFRPVARLHMARLALAGVGLHLFASICTQQRHAPGWTRDGERERERTQLQEIAQAKHPHSDVAWAHVTQM